MNAPANRCRFIMHKGKEILITDYSNLTPETFIPVIQKATEFLLNSKKKNILELVDVSNSYGNPAVMSELKRTALESQPYIIKRAIVGVTGVKKVLLTAVTAFTKEKMMPFASMEEAKDYLVSD